MSEESIENPHTSDISFTSELIGDYQFNKVEFKGIKKNVVDLSISYQLDTWSRDLNTDFTLRNCLFGVVKLTKNADSCK